MRALIDIPQEDLNLLNRLSKKVKLSRAELVRQAIAAYLAPHQKATRVQGFGLWADKPVDGLTCQEKLRGEWHS